MLITGAELEGGALADIRIANGHVAAIGQLTPLPDEPVIQAGGGLLLPGLHDHHIHVAAQAAALTSVFCGQPGVTNPDQLAASLRRPGQGWLRATGYHESIAGMLDAATLDRICPDRPLRVQHRSGRMWFLNSAALDLLLATGAPPPGLERAPNGYTGRLFDSDSWLRDALGATPPSFAEVGAMLAQAGITGLTDMSPANDAATAGHFAAEQDRGALPQRVLLAGTLCLAEANLPPTLSLGAAKLHLHEAALPEWDQAVGFIRAAHAQSRPVAVHCVTETELVFTLAAIAEAGAAPGDRIEHASIAPDTAVEEIARLGLAVATQPHFIALRGDSYLAEVEPELHAILYRLRAFLDVGIPLAAGSDAPFGGTDPWSAMAAAVSRRTASGARIGAAEALSPEQALDLYLRAPEALGQRRRVAVGVPADLCLLDRPWAQARTSLAAIRVAATLIGGRLVHDGVDQAPAERRRRADTPA